MMAEVVTDECCHASEMLELPDMATRQARSVPEMVRWIIRRYLYGNSRRAGEDRQETNSGFQRLGE
jgi:hypothetical protein